MFLERCVLSPIFEFLTIELKKSWNVFATSISLDRGALVTWDRKLGVDKYQGDFCVIGSVSVMDELISLSAIRKKSLFWLSLFIILSFWISMLILWSKRFLLIFLKIICFNDFFVNAVMVWTLALAFSSVNGWIYTMMNLMHLILM